MDKKCLDCKTDIDIRKIRCKDCAKKRRSIINTACFERRNNTGLRHIKINCTQCKQEYKRDKYSIGKPFCSPACKGRYVYEQEQQKRNKLFDQGKLKYRKRIRTILLEQYGNICQICKNTEWNKQPIPLQVDHIDGNAANNLPSNLRMICHNCDALLPTFAGKNKGHGRKSRGLKNYE